MNGNILPDNREEWDRRRAAGLEEANGRRSLYHKLAALGVSLAVMAVVFGALYLRSRGDGPSPQPSRAPTASVDVVASAQLMRDEAQAAAVTLAAGLTPPAPVPSPGCAIVAAITQVFDTKREAKRAQVGLAHSHPDLIVGNGLAPEGKKWRATSLVEAC